MEKYHNVNEVSDCRQLNPIWRSIFLNYLVDQLTFHLVPTRVPSVLINSLNNLLVDYSLLKILGNSHTTRFSISLTNNSSSNPKFQYPLICCFDEVRKSGKKAIKVPFSVHHQNSIHRIRRSGTNQVQFRFHSKNLLNDDSQTESFSWRISVISFR